MILASPGCEKEIQPTSLQRRDCQRDEKITGHGWFQLNFGTIEPITIDVYAVDSGSLLEFSDRGIWYKCGLADHDNDSINQVWCSASSVDRVLDFNCEVGVEPVRSNDMLSHVRRFSTIFCTAGGSAPGSHSEPLRNHVALKTS